LAATQAALTRAQLLPPAEAKVGERVRFGEAPQGPPDSDNKLQKKKVWEALQPGLCTSGGGAVGWRPAAGAEALPMLTSAGPVTVTRILNGSVS